MSQQDWDIKPRSKVCQRCQKEFTDRQAYFTGLSFGEGGYQRIDCCEPCWGPQSQEVTYYSYWQGLFRVPPAEPDRAVRKEDAESLLRRLMELKDDARRNAVYILAVMLERQRLFAHTETQTRIDGVRVLVYEHKKTGEVFLIPDPQLRLDQLDYVQQEVMALLTAPDAVLGSGTAVAPDATAPAVAPADPAPAAAPDPAASGPTEGGRA